MSYQFYQTFRNNWFSDFVLSIKLKTTFIAVPVY